ncbi:MAG: carboxy terminal-processing peptidase [Bacteroidetes bacterium]|nr:carboxy terminal-processing peptidase [Bacteroidota bacterium]
MKTFMRKYFIFFLIPMALATVWAFAHTTETKAKKDEQLIARIIADILENGHYTSTRLDDKVSKYAFNEYLKRLDYSKLYFLESDIEKLREYELLIDDEMKTQDLKFYFEATEISKKRIKEVEDEFEEWLDKPFNFNEEEQIELEPDNRSYFKSKKEREAYWKLYLKYMTMNRIANKLEKQEKDQEAAEKANEDFIPKTKDELEEEARKAVLKDMKTRFERMNELDEEDQFALFVNSVAAGFGPHSEYFPPQEKENFDMRMTGRLEGIGAQLTKEGDYIKVVEIVPGSASWRQGQLKANDLILKVAQGTDEPVEVVGASMKEAIKMIRGPKGTEVQLTVQKPEGEVLVIPIIRDIVVQEEAYAKSAIIENEKTGRKIGYVYLPNFYFKSGGKGRSSAEDVKNEVNRLTEQGATGIILDLRNNGGGSLDDAVKMAGHFVSKGPVVQVKSENASPEVLRDKNPAISYDGPMIVMVNNFSASASEIVSGALKDYKRAVIVGTTTLGKGTVQRFLDLQQFTGGIESEGELGAFKLTLQQFYRINGASTQLHGVRPDIVLPDLYGYMETGMRQYDNALPFDSIQPVYYSTWDQFEYDYKGLRKSSKNRVKKAEVFKELDARNQRFKNERENSIEVISVEKELAERARIKEENKAFNELFKGNSEYSVTSLQEFKPEESEDVVAEKKSQWEKSLKEDYYLDETLKIMEDILAKLN